MINGYFLDKEGYPVRLNFGSSDKVVSISEMFKTISFDQVLISCSNELVKEYEAKGYKFVPQPKKIDYKELLKKYIKHVESCEGINFLSTSDFWMSDVNFTELEIKALNELV